MRYIRLALAISYPAIRLAIPIMIAACAAKACYVLSSQPSVTLEAEDFGSFPEPTQDGEFLILIRPSKVREIKSLHRIGEKTPIRIHGRG